MAAKVSDIVLHGAISQCSIPDKIKFSNDYFQGMHILPSSKTGAAQFFFHISYTQKWPSFFLLFIPFIISSFFPFFFFSLSTSFLSDYLSYLLFVFSFFLYHSILYNCVFLSFFSFSFLFLPFIFLSVFLSFLYLSSSFFIMPSFFFFYFSFFFLYIHSPFICSLFPQFPHFLLFPAVFTFLDRKYLKYYVCTR